ncbi:bifunctional hydroxymethylpyrimidine kinase/phosphomethylpyrimidine kinase [Pilimelia columellifera]|uniref:bifunctional hydroxymethylpyrimidine kinase/phosphomethylpyrimidine kinase n=1 Tax=Pilimelia columellifera TaxID=706574 RepID=UPI0031E16727
MVALTIAGSDSCGGAGVQADLRTFAAHGLHGASVITAVTAQNTVGVRLVRAMTADVVTAQLDAVLADLPVAVVKIGMLASGEIGRVLAHRAAAGVLPPFVLDPVLVSSSGARLGSAESVTRLLPYARVLTPNRAEAGALLGRPVRTSAEASAAARELAALGPAAVVVTGGDAVGAPVDNLWTTGVGGRAFAGQRVATRNTHGTGCTFASALAARLALGDDIPTAVGAARLFVARALAGACGWQLGAGHGPLDQLGWGSGEG